MLRARVLAEETCSRFLSENPIGGEAETHQHVEHSESSRWLLAGVWAGQRSAWAEHGSTRPGTHWVLRGGDAVGFTKQVKLETGGAEMNTVGSKENSGGHVESVSGKHMRRKEERLVQEQKPESSWSAARRSEWLSGEMRAWVEHCWDSCREKGCGWTTL